MSLQALPAELMLQIFRQSSSISAAINLSLTCRRLNELLRNSRKIHVLFCIAERVWGPVDDIFQLLTHSAAHPAHVKRQPLLSFALLVQVSRIGRVAVWYEKMYTKLRWDDQRSHLRRELNSREAYALRRAVYRSWLYDKAFHNSAYPRTIRYDAAVISERCQLLRNWSSEELVELEDARWMFESLLAMEICPTDGEVYWRLTSDNWNKHMSAVGTEQPSLLCMHSLFHDSREDEVHTSKQMPPACQLREQRMAGWGDNIEQYHTLNDMLKLNPADIMWLHEYAITRQDVENFVEAKIGGQWFWNNGETMLHTWLLILHSRGLHVQELREAISNGRLGVVSEQD